MAYIDNFGKLDWALEFNRTGKFPLDRSSMFGSYADALAYAKQDGTDTRKIGGTSYVGQIISVFGPGVDGVTDEIAAYIITAVGTGATLMKFAQSSASGDVEDEIQKLAARITEVEGKLKVASAEADGLLSKENFTKLLGIATGAQVNVIESVKVNGEALEIADKAVNIDLSSYAKTAYVNTELGKKVNAVEGKGLSTNDYDAAAVAEVAKIKDKADASTVTDLAGKVTKNTEDIAKINTDLEGLTGAMHFIGTSTADPAGEGGAVVEGHETFKAGDVCLFGNKEYVYNDVTGKWVELGDEGSHATKGYVDEAKQAAIEAANAATDTKLEAYSNTVAVEGLIATAKGEAVTEAGTAADGKIAEALKAYTTTEALNTELGKKVDKVTGKSLVDDTLITKMEGIKDNAVIKGVEGGIKLDAETGKISIDAATVPVIAQAKVDGLVDKLAEVDAAIAEKKDEAGVNALIAAATIKAEKIEGVVAEAAKVSHALTAGGKVFDGSEAVEITAADLGALTAIGRATDSAFGGIMVGYISTEENRAVQLDETGKAYVNVPKAAEALVKSVSAEFEVSAEGQLSVKSVNVNKLAQTDGDKLVLDGGNAAN